MNKLALPMVDVFCNMFFIMFIFFVYCAALINPADQETPTAPPRAEVMVISEWTDIKSDIDVWIRRIDHEICGYKCREIGPFILQNDHVNATTGMVDGKPREIANEVMDIINKYPGIYQVSLHGYNVRTENLTTPCNLRVQQVSPFISVLEIDVEVTSGEELPVCQFEIDKSGNIINVITDPDVLTKFL